MDELDDDEDQEGLIRKLTMQSERRRSLNADFDDFTNSDEGASSEWSEWMCVNCGIFLKEHRRVCPLCRSRRL